MVEPKGSRAGEARELPPLRLLYVRALGGAEDPGSSLAGAPAEPERAVAGEKAAAPGEKAAAPGEKAGAVLAWLRPPELPPKLGPSGEGEALRSWLPARSTGLPRESCRPLGRGTAAVDPKPPPLPPPPKVNGRALTFKPMPPPAMRPEPAEGRPPAVLGRPAAAARPELVVGLVV